MISFFKNFTVFWLIYRKIGILQHDFFVHFSLFVSFLTTLRAQNQFSFVLFNRKGWRKILSRAKKNKEFCSLSKFSEACTVSWLMCLQYSESLNMVTPTKKQSRRGQRKTTPSPPNAEFCQFKTPQKQYQSYPKSYFYSEPPRIVKNHRRSVTPKNLSTSPLNFAGPKCLEPPTPCSLPKPPTTWTRPEDMPNARQTLSFEDLVKLDETNPQDLSQQLKMLLKVQG